MSRAATARRLYDWEDYRSWPDDQRWEVIDGEAFAMSPAPHPRHQLIAGEIFAGLHACLTGSSCRAIMAPVDVRLSVRDVVQPDVVVVCRPEQITRTHIEGAPALVVEVLSASTALFDRTRKLRLYARSGVGEVWLVTPYPWLVEVLQLDGATYRVAGTYTKTDTLASPTFPGLAMDLGKVFDFPLEPGEEVPMVREGHPPYATRRKRAGRGAG
jgi:Uma2 family endonuclease